MRLIDADKLYNWIRTECNPYGKPTIDFESGNRVLDIIKRMPTAYDKESVLSEMTEKYEDAINMYSMDIGTAYSFSSSVRKETWGKAIDIVEKGGIE